MLRRMSPLTRDDLVFSAGTHLVTPLLERLAPVKRAGFAGLSVYPYEVEALRGEGLSDSDLRDRIADAGLAVGELDAITTWLPNHRPPPSFPDDMARDLLLGTPERLCPIGEAIGYGATPGVEEAAESFASACDVAARHGLLLHLEFLPWTGIPDLATALRIVELADRPNGGVLLDSWHFFRSGAGLHQLADVPGDRILYVQLDDAPAIAEADLSDETQHRRLVPGNGSFDLVGLIGALDRIGYNGPFGVEVFSDALAARPIGDVASEVFDATHSVLDLARRD
jgi:sugar phosphate isomerase/epimerase